MLMHDLVVSQILHSIIMEVKPPLLSYLNLMNTNMKLFMSEKNSESFQLLPNKEFSAKVKTTI